MTKILKYAILYDRLSRVIQRTVTDLATCNSSQETFNYDSAGNILYSATNSDYSAYTYDSNNRLISYNGMAVTYDADGNMTSAYLDCTGELFRYDSTNRLAETTIHTSDETLVYTPIYETRDSDGAIDFNESWSCIGRYAQNYIIPDDFSSLSYYEVIEHY